MEFQHVVELVGKGVDAVGVAVMVIGAVLATVVAAARLARHGDEIYRTYRRRLGRSILLGLEFLVAADIIRTVAIEPTSTSVGVLAAIVLIRTFLTSLWSWRSPVDGRGRSPARLPARPEGGSI